MLFDLSPGGLVVEISGKRVDYAAARVRTIRWQRPDSLRNGALMAQPQNPTGVPSFPHRTAAIAVPAAVPMITPVQMGWRENQPRDDLGC